MCGIAGMIRLKGAGPLPGKILRAMANAILHRGPDEDGYLERPELGFASRRLSIVGLADGRQPIANEDGSVAVVYNGELFDYPEVRADLEARGHRFRTRCDTELLPHLWEEYGEGMLEKLHGQFAFALWDQRKRQVILARDRFGICPLFYTQRGDWLLFGSEIKALLASGMVTAKPDPRGIHQIFTFFALPGPVTCFEGVSCLRPAHYLSIQLGGLLSNATKEARITEGAYWEPNFPDAGHEEEPRSPRQLAEDFEAVLLKAVERRLRADVPVVSYLSGGVDSSVVVAMATRLRQNTGGTAIPTFTIRVTAPGLDEVPEALRVADYIGARPVVVDFGRDEKLRTYPALIRAAEAPVVDTSCAALLMLAAEVHGQGYKVALTGEGSDEWLAGYPWFKIHKLLGCLDVVPGLPVSMWLRTAFLKLGRLDASRLHLDRAMHAVGGNNSWLDFYSLYSMSQLHFFSRQMWEQLGDYVPYEDLQLNLERMRRWSPLNRALVVGGRLMLAGHLMAAKGDRVAMNSSVETRYPFLDDDVFDFLAKLPPHWKLRRLREKYALRLVAERWLPKSIAWRGKAMFRAPFDGFHTGGKTAPAFVEQLLSPESLGRTGFFDVAQVTHWRKAYRGLWKKSAQRLVVEMGLVGVIATQLWYHTFVDASLADLPSLAGRQPDLKVVGEPAA
jgi:asparagine synthase (glutamine-hydrolysing)